MKNKWPIRFSTEENGFTLIELTIVIFIISVLVGMAIFTLRNTAGVELRACQANLRILDGAIIQYYLNEEDYPNGFNELVPKYLKTIPKCPTESEDRDYGYDSVNHKTTCPNGHTYP